MDLETLHQYEPFLFLIVIGLILLALIVLRPGSRCWACDKDIPMFGNKHILNGVEYECFNGRVK